MKAEKFVPLQISENNPNELFENHQTELAKAIIRAIDYALTNRRKKMRQAAGIVQAFCAHLSRKLRRLCFKQYVLETL
jgi:hypothetical protein